MQTECKMGELVNSFFFFTDQRQKTFACTAASSYWQRNSGRCW